MPLFPKPNEEVSISSSTTVFSQFHRLSSSLPYEIDFAYIYKYNKKCRFHVLQTLRYCLFV